MSVQTPPTLLELARQGLLRDEDLAVSSLEVVPRELFPGLFKDAFNGRHTKTLKAMVAAWPFPCLPVGALMRTFNLETFQAVLEGLDVLLMQKVRPSRCKLQELNLQNAHHNFWDVWAGTEGGSCSAGTVSEKQAAKPLPRYVLRRRRLKVVADLCFMFQLDEEEIYFLEWAQQRRGSLELCCTQLKIVALPLESIRKVLTVFQPEHIQVLELNTDCNGSTLAHYAPYLGQMRSLQELFLVGAHKNRFEVVNTSRFEKKHLCRFFSQFSKLSSLQQFHMNGVCILSEHMQLLFRCLKTPLETLSITQCLLLQSDLDPFFWCRSLHQLKHLDMSEVLLCDICITPLRVLLENVAGTLETLELQGCRLKDSQISVLLPALSQCPQLTKLNFYDNDISIPVLSDLLHHTASWSELTVEQYPAPLECYDDMGCVLIEDFIEICPDLMDALRALRQPKRISFATKVCTACNKRCVYDGEARLCSCWQ